MNPYNFSVLCFGFCSLLLGLFIWLKRADYIGKIYFLFTLVISLWGMLFGICWAYNDSSARAVFFIRAADIAAIFIPPTWLHFALAYTEQLRKFRTFLIISYLIAALLSLFGFSRYFIVSLEMTPLGLVFVQPGMVFYIFTVYFLILVLFGFALFIGKILRLPSNEKPQLFRFVLAISLGFIGGGLQFPPVYGIYIPQYAIFLMPFYPFLIAYFMIRHGLFDVEQLAQAAHRDKLTAIGVLAASINHEVKNPLFIIKGLAESCLERQKEGIFHNKEKALESANDAMKRSIDQADRAMDIIKRLSLFAKAGIDSEIQFEPVKVAAVIDDILPLIRYELAAQNITLTREIPSDLPDVHADRRYLEEILFNLLVNAVQAIKGTGKSGEIKVTAKTVITRNEVTRQSKNKIASPAVSGLAGFEKGDSPFNAFRGTVPLENPVLITVADNGPGIPEDKLKDVFRPFYTTKAEGTGLGLYITQQLVEKVHGRIDVRSEVNKGTTFTLIFPKAQGY